MIKKIDDLGRIAIPKEWRRQLQWMGGDEIELSLQDNTVVLEKYRPDFALALLDVKDRLQDWAEDNDIELPEDFLTEFARLINQTNDLTS